MSMFREGNTAEVRRKQSYTIVIGYIQIRIFTLYKHHSSDNIFLLPEILCKWFLHKTVTVRKLLPCMNSKCLSSIII